MKKREHRLFIRVTDAERNRILDKMYGMGIHSLSAYKLNSCFLYKGAVRNESELPSQNRKGLCESDF